MNTGIGDAENLAWKLAMVVKGAAGHALLDSYEAERRPIAAKALKSTGAASNLVLGNHVLARLLRDRVVVPLMNRASMQRRVRENLSQLKVTYRNGPLGRRARRWLSGQGPRPGDRMPDIACVRAGDGAPTTLHAELGTRWALVMPARLAGDKGDECTAQAAKQLGDDNVVTLIADHDAGVGPEAQADDKAEAEAMLVRPDAHVGWQGRADSTALGRWLTGMARQGRAG
jgi:4,5-epoxidase